MGKLLPEPKRESENADASPRSQHPQTPNEATTAATDAEAADAAGRRPPPRRLTAGATDLCLSTARPVPA